MRSFKPNQHDNKYRKVALVTGSAMGIGLACAEAFAKAGHISSLGGH